jgi:hypothetical protein
MTEERSLYLRFLSIFYFFRLALPFAYYQAGFVFGTVLLLVSAWATSASIGLLVKACDEYRLPTYEKIVERVLGRRARNIVEMSILIFCIGTGELVSVIVSVVHGRPILDCANFAMWD